MSPAVSIVWGVHPRAPGAGRGGFSLLEVLIAVALSALLLVAVNFFVLGMGELWGNGAEARLFDRHVRGVARFLENLVGQAVVPIADTTRPAADAAPTTLLAPRPGAGAAAPQRGFTSGRPLAGVAWISGDTVAGWARRATFAAWWRRAGGGLRAAADPDAPRGGRDRLPPGVRDSGPNQPPASGAARSSAQQSTGDTESTEPRFRFGNPAAYEGVPPMLMFEVDEAPGQCVWPQRPLPQVECALQVNADEGLVLLWKSKLEEDYGKGRPRKTQLSPFARSISFDYYDAERKAWTHSDQPQADGQGGWLVPQRVRVTFAYHGIEREISITLPEAPEGAPLR